VFADRLPSFLRLAAGVDWEKTSLKPYVALLDAHGKTLMEEARRRKRGDKSANLTTSEPLRFFPPPTLAVPLLNDRSRGICLTLRLVTLGPAWLGVHHHRSWLPLLLRFVRSMSFCRSIGERYGSDKISSPAFLPCHTTLMLGVLMEYLAHSSSFGYIAAKLEGWDFGLAYLTSSPGGLY